MRHLYICDFHKNFIQSVRNKRKRKTSDDGGDSPEHETDVPEVSSCQELVDSLTLTSVGPGEISLEYSQHHNNYCEVALIFFISKT